MATEKQIAANRRNALKSTGPRTPEGKARCRFNALKHGLLSRAVIINAKAHHESREEFDSLLARLMDELSPIGTLEHLQVETIAVCYWRSQRALRAESIAIHERYVERAEQKARRDDFDRRYPRLSADLARPHALQGRGPAPTNCETNPMPGTEPAEPIPDEYPLPTPDKFLPLLRYESTIDRQLQRALDRLEKLQTTRAHRTEKLVFNRPPSPPCDMAEVARLRKEYGLSDFPTEPAAPAAPPAPDFDTLEPEPDDSFDRNCDDAPAPPSPAPENNPSGPLNPPHPNEFLNRPDSPEVR